MRKILVFVAGICAVVAAVPVPAAWAAQPAAWSEPTSPFEIVDDIYYVGTKGLASYLIVSDGEGILLDGTLDENVGHIEQNIQALGFKLVDVKIIVNTHAHFDHAAGIAGLKRDTGAKVMAMEQERSALENGRHEGDNVYGATRFPAVKVDRALHDGDTISVGSVTMTATLTPGHTKGCTTWSMSAKDGEVTRQVVFPCSLTVAGNKLVGNAGHPTIVEDYEKSFELLKSMKADIVLPAHPEFGDIFERKAKRDAGDADAFVDTGLLQKLAETSRVAFEKELKAAQK
nr:BJP_beta_lactamase [uncultured bacterium]AIA13203.1 BJP_beta_lactamase [uncultured bacterium]AIA13535.1 BJP_beta_lactamase [uncultured bacterium]